jgi:hypothetical protein
MNDQADTLDQADEEILTYTDSDEALEAAAAVPCMGIPSNWLTCSSYSPQLNCC